MRNDGQRIGEGRVCSNHTQQHTLYVTTASAAKVQQYTGPNRVTHENINFVYANPGKKNLPPLPESCAFDIRNISNLG